MILVRRRHNQAISADEFYYTSSHVVVSTTRGVNGRNISVQDANNETIKTLPFGLYVHPLHIRHHVP